jgi:restriction endonuclease S subunit
MCPGDRNVTWIAYLDSSWRSKPLKYLCRLNANVLTEGTDPNFEFHYLDISSVNSEGDWVMPEPIRFGDSPSRARRLLKTGDVLISTVRTYLQAITHIGDHQEDLVCSTGFAVLSPSEPVDAGYLAYWVRSTWFVNEIVARSVGVSYPAINAFEIGSLPFPTIALSHQRTIAAFLDRETERIDSLIAKKQRQIELLNEKRAALISRTVTRGLNPDARMKASGIDWLGEIPEHWEVRRLKYVSSVNDEVLMENVPADWELLYVDIGSVDAVAGITKQEPMAFEDAPSRARRRVRHGDTIVSTVRTYLKAIAPILNPEPNLIVSTGFAVIRPREVEAGFMSFCLRSSYFVEAVVSRSVGVSYPATNASEVMTIPVPLPSPEEQRAIGKYLEYETARIDTLVAKIQAGINQLQEYRTALITAAVTGKIDVRQEATHARTAH